MDRKLLIQGIAKFLAGVVLLGVLLFLPAGTLAWPQGWRLMGILFIPMLFAGIVMIRKNPELLRKRLNAKEKQAEQQDVLKLSALMFLAAFILAGLNFRFGWIVLPDWISWTAVAIFLLSYGLYAEVMRENAYLSRTVEVQENQKVIDTGLYGIVRHPMYMSTLFLQNGFVLVAPCRQIIHVVKRAGFNPFKVADIVHGNAGSAVGGNASLDINVDFGIVVPDLQGVFPGCNVFFDRDVVFAVMLGTNADFAFDIRGLHIDVGAVQVIFVSVFVQINMAVNGSAHVIISGSAFLDRGVDAAL